jgi:acetyl esterase/lipase
MKIFEILLCAFSLLALILSFIKKYNNKSYFVLILLIPLYVLNYNIEGFRWHMFGVYIYSILIILSLVFTNQNNKKYSRINKTIKVFSLISVSLSTILILLFGANPLPDIDGEYNVGTMSYDLIDVNRNEIYNNTENESRKIRIQIFFPVDDIRDGQIIMWHEDKAIPRAMIKFWTGLSAPLLDYSTQIETNSYENVMISEAEEKYPVVIISHGWMGIKSLHTHHAEMLASNGYIVINIDHTYGSMATIFEDDTIAYLDENALPPNAEQSYSINLVDTYSKDTGLVLNHIIDLNSGNLANEDIIIHSKDDDLEMFYNRLDGENIGIAGHSTGGGGAVKLAVNDSRVKAVFGLDPWVEAVGVDTLEKGIDVEFLFLRSNEWQVGDNNDYLKILIDESDTITGYQTYNTTHQDFIYIHSFNPLMKIMGIVGKLNTNTNFNIQMDYLLSFFDRTLKGIDNDLEDIADRYDAVDIIKWE